MRIATLVPCPATSKLLDGIVEDVIAIFVIAVAIAIAIFFVAVLIVVLVQLTATTVNVGVAVAAATLLVAVAFVFAQIAAIDDNEYVVVVNVILRFVLVRRYLFA